MTSRSISLKLRGAGLLALFCGSLLVGFSGALAPGPLLGVVIAGSAGQGFWTGPLLVAGHALAELALVLALAWGIGSVLKKPAVTRAIAAAGAAVLFWMAWGMVAGGLSGTLALRPEAVQPTRVAWPIVQGVLVSVGNPYWLLWWTTVGAGFVALSLGRGAGGLAAVYTGHILSDLSWYSFVALLVAGGRQWLDPQMYRYIVVGSGLFLVGMALYFLRSAVAWPPRHREPVAVSG